MEVTELKKEKSRKLIELETARRTGQNRVVFRLGSEVAAIEHSIANDYLKKNEYDNAVVNLISQASCLIDSRRYSEAVKVLNFAFSISTVDQTKNWIQEQLNQFKELTLRENPFEVLTPNIENNSGLRIPQKEAYFAVKRFFEKNNDHAIVQLPVGCGKTGAMSLLPFELSSRRVLAIAPNLEIRKNLYENFNYYGDKSFLRKHNVLSNGFGPSCAYLDGEANIHDCDSADIVVTNIQQLSSKGSTKWLSMLPADFFDMILIDEAHHNVADSWKNVISYFEKAKKISFTATPMRSDGKKVEGKRVYRFPIVQAIIDGYVKDIASRTLEPKEIHFTYKGDEKKVSLDEIMKLREKDWFSRGVALSRECNESIVDASIQAMNDLGKSGEKHQIIGVACSIDHANSIKALYLERNIRTEVVHSNLPQDEIDEVLSMLKNSKIDAIVQVQMLGEGADYPNLSVAAIFRPFRHLMPYVQFVGRVMRVIKQDSPGHLANRGYVVSHIGLNIDRWWEELKEFDQDDENFLNELALGEHEFIFDKPDESDPSPKRRRFKADMDVIEEAIVHFIQDRFVPEDARLIVDDLIQAMNMRGIDFEALGLSREELEAKILKTHEEQQKRGKFTRLQVSPQEARKVARQRLDERVRSGAKELLNELQFKVGGFDLPKLFPSTTASANLPAAIILLNRAVLDYLKVGSKERDLLKEDQLRSAHDNMDEIIDTLAAEIRKKIEEK